MVAPNRIMDKESELVLERLYEMPNSGISEEEMAFTANALVYPSIKVRILAWQIVDDFIYEFNPKVLRGAIRQEKSERVLASFLDILITEPKSLSRRLLGAFPKRKLGLRCSLYLQLTHVSNGSAEAIQPALTLYRHLKRPSFNDASIAIFALNSYAKRHSKTDEFRDFTEELWNATVLRQGRKSLEDFRAFWLYELEGLM